MHVYTYMHPIHDACPCFLDDRDIEWTHAVLRTCSLCTSTSQLGISSVIFSSLAATSSQLQPLSQYKYIRVWRICRLRTEENVVCQSGGSSQGSGSIRQDCQGCICISTLCYERLQRRACRMSSPGSRVPKVPVTRFVVSHRFHDICPSRNLFLLAATERSRVLCILGANDEWQRLEVVLWWIVYVARPCPNKSTAWRAASKPADN
ncbi:hypothetical protein GGI42DRAFT_126652 [Trichoderma sp. SZMC 28013]